MKLNQYIDHTLLKPEATPDSIEKLCGEAIQYNFAAVCINPCYVDLAAHLVKGSGVKVATVIGFPLGATLSSVKVFEAQEAILRKADELDLVINLGAAKLGLWQAVTDEIKHIVNIAEGSVVKVIVETGLLTEEEKKLACNAVLEAGAAYIKTSTGFGPGGATIDDIKLFKAIAGTKLGIKASGGIRTREQAVAMIAAGATRIGTSSGIQIVSH
ncbi:deoxyribose-phosphate aldolase [Dendrosporobacter sp. 1207_IL3150]|uniref:deoxyribose-phosphate aldolase n=1 Tax=Dendrosporobacter sp. 1207_IL3150 TaxID=3084054 RepID=UPI002FDB4914